jgi:hypothetical protein
MPGSGEMTFAAQKNLPFNVQGFRGSKVKEVSDHLQHISGFKLEL